MAKQVNHRQCKHLQFCSSNCFVLLRKYLYQILLQFYIQKVLCYVRKQYIMAYIVVPWCSSYHYCTTSFCTGSNTAHGMLDIHDGEDLWQWSWQWSWLEIRLNAFCQSTIPQKQSIIITFVFFLILRHQVLVDKCALRSIITCKMNFT